MTFEQKVKKIRGIVDKKIVIWCERRSEDKELSNLIKELIGKNDVMSYWQSYKESECCILMSGIWNHEKVRDCKIEDYQIIPYSEFFADDKVDKPLGEWTLKEVQEYCKYDEMSKDNPDYCNECKCNKICGMCADEWNLSDKPSLTQSEIDILKAIKVLYGGDVKILYAESIDCFVDDDDTCQIPIFTIKSDRLPSLSHDREYSIDELLKEMD